MKTMNDARAESYLYGVMKEQAADPHSPFCNASFTVQTKARADRAHDERAHDKERSRV